MFFRLAQNKSVVSLLMLPGSHFSMTLLSLFFFAVKVSTLRYQSISTSISTAVDFASYLLLYLFSLKLAMKSLFAWRGRQTMHTMPAIKDTL